MSVQLFYGPADFKAIDNLPLKVYFTQDNEEPEFDIINDERLLRQHAGDIISYDNKSQLPEYEALIDRPSFDLKLHPQQQAMRKIVAETFESDEPEQLIVFVYHRSFMPNDVVDREKTRQQSQNLFVNQQNGLQDAKSEPVILFDKYSNDPFMQVVIVWHDQPRGVTTYGTVAVTVVQKFSNGA